ncbi:glycosyltransferase family 2 protein [Edwardsiella tarda]
MKSYSEKQVVTVAVITYHSALTVIETLDSIVHQSYGAERIELIISDDGSTDNTVQVIDEWLLHHRNKFYRAIFFANKCNGGISKNCNIAWKAATSEWIKTIAGDDILLPTCISDNVNYINSQEGENISVLFSKMQSFKVEASGLRSNLSILPTHDELHFFQLSALEQYRHLQREGITGSPSVFINREKLSDIGFADERFLVEDFPLWFKFVSGGIKLHFMDVVTVFYRVGDSVSRNKTTLINKRFINDLINIDDVLVIPSLRRRDIITIFRKKVWTRLSLVIAAIFRNRVNFISRLIMLSIFSIRPGFLKHQIYKLKKKG